MRERSVETVLKNECKKVGAFCLKMDASSMAGVPDRLVLYGGRAWFVELKAPGRKPRELQIHVHHQLQMAGFEVAVLDSPELVREWMREVLTR